MIGQFLWRRDIKNGLYQRAIEEEENEEAINEKLVPDADDNAGDHHNGQTHTEDKNAQDIERVREIK
jgi:hypothetical protein